MILHEEKIPAGIRNAFMAKLIDIAKRLLVEPDWLMAVLHSESRLNPQAVNKQRAEVAGYDENGKIIKAAGTPDSLDPYERAKYRATGLLQWMPAVAKSLGTSTRQLFYMDAIRQLDYVEKYFSPYKGKIRSYEDLYLITFYPNADKKQGGTLQKPDEWAFPDHVYQRNRGLDVNGDGKITIADFKQWIQSRLPAGVVQRLSQLKKK